MELAGKICLIISISCFSLSAMGMAIRISEHIFNRPGKVRWIKNAPYTRLIRETIRFTNDILHEKNIKEFPGFEIRYYSHKKWAGVFNGQVVVYLKSNPDILFLVNTVLHEVMHYMQSRTDKQYKRHGEYTYAYGYLNNPFEKEARSFAANNLDACLKYLESKKLIINYKL